jgi:hypothetical protein
LITQTLLKAADVAAAFKSNGKEAMISKKILNCSRVLVILLAVTMGFTISMSLKATFEPEQVPVNLEEINIKLDRIIEEGRARDTVLLQQLIKIQQQLGMNEQGKIAEVLHK